MDFRVRYNPEKDSKEDIAKRILYSIIVKKVKAKLPRVIFISGDSGTGKSLSGALKLMQILMEVQGVELTPELVDAMNVYTPLQYPQKLQKLLFNKEYKKANVFSVHEARDVVRAKNWQNFLTQAIADVNAQSRSIKPLVFIIVSQFIRDITSDVRYTINLYIRAKRPVGKKTRLYIDVMWKDDRDPDKPRLKKRKLFGELIYPNGRRKTFIPSYIDVSLPPKWLVEQFEKDDYAAKYSIIQRKMKKLVDDMTLEAGEDSQKINAIAEYYLTHTEQLPNIGRQVRGQWKLKPHVRDMHELDRTEAKFVENKINDGMQKRIQSLTSVEAQDFEEDEGGK